MTTIHIVTVFGRWDEAYERLQKIGLTLTIENTVDVPHTSALPSQLYELWYLAAVGIIESFTVKAGDIRAMPEKGA